MFITAKLVFENYVPDELLKGMWFKQRVKDVIYGKVYEYDKIFELTHIPEYESYVAVNGYPVKPMVMTITANPDDNAILLAHPEQIGWWDEDPSFDEMRDIELKDINMILCDYDGEIEIEVDIHEDELGEEIVSSVIYMDKVTLSVPGLHTEYDYYMNEDFDEDTPPDDYENMDWEDDEPEEDSAGFTENDRQPRSHFVTNEEADFDALMEREYKKHKHSDDKCVKHDADHDTE